MKLAGAHVEIDSVQGEDAREPFRDPGQPEQGLRFPIERGDVPGLLHVVPFSYGPYLALTV
jgi:hypothetical protein